MTVSEEESQIEIEKLRSTNQQAAEYGLALLNEKNLLEDQYEELENQYESLKLELEQLKDQLKTVQVNKHEEILEGKTHQEILLNEKQTREDDLINEIKYYEQELRSLKQDNESLQMENKNLHFNSQQLKERIEEFDQFKMKFKYDLQESIHQEQKLLDANTELIEENLLLRQQGERLEQHLMNYDGFRVENKQLEENIDDLHRTIEELESLKTISESQFIELHENLLEERKQKHIYKQQLDEQIQKESLRNLSSLRMTIDGKFINSHNDYLNSCGDDDDDDASYIRSSVDYSDISETDQQLTGNLFSEIHVNEIRKLEAECFQLSQQNSSLDNQLLTINETTRILSQKIQNILDKILLPNQILFNSNDTNNLLMTSIDSIEQMNIIINKNLHLFNDEQEHTISKLKQDLNILMKQYNHTQIMFIKTHEKLLNFSEELENIQAFAIPSNDIQIKKQQITEKIFDPTMNEYILNIIQEQIEQLKQSSRNNPSDDTQDQIIKQHSLLTTKLEQINTLRKLLNENKQTTEIALSNLKSKYENEKFILTETISKLRLQLKSLKEDITSYSLSRNRYATRCEEYIIQFNQSQRQIQAAEEEKKTLNSLLRLVIEQKLLLTQKLDAFEIENNRSRLSPNPTRRIINPAIPENLLSITANQNNNLTAERGKFIPPRIMKTFPQN